MASKPPADASSMTTSRCNDDCTSAIGTATITVPPGSRGVVSTATRQSPDPLTDPVVNSRGELERARSPLDSFGCADELVAWTRLRMTSLASRSSPYVPGGTTTGGVGPPPVGPVPVVVVVGPALVAGAVVAAGAPPGRGPPRPARAVTSRLTIGIDERTWSSSRWYCDRA